MAERKDDPLYYQNPVKAAQIAERAAAEERLKELEKKSKKDGDAEAPAKGAK